MGCDNPTHPWMIIIFIINIILAISHHTVALVIIYKIMYAVAQGLVNKVLLSILIIL